MFYRRKDPAIGIRLQEPFRWVETKVIIWIPEYFFVDDPLFRRFPCMPCPNCGHHDGISAKQFTTGKGVIGHHETYPLLGYRYECSICREKVAVLKRSGVKNEDININASFMSYDPGSISHLPAHLRSIYDQYFVSIGTAANSNLFEREILADIKYYMNEGLGPTACRRAVLEAHERLHLLRERNYYLKLAVTLERQESLFVQDAGEHPLPIPSLLMPTINSLLSSNHTADYGDFVRFEATLSAHVGDVSC